MVPEKLSTYIKEQFGNSFTSGIKKVKTQAGKYVYLAEISQDDVLYHLKFNEHGELLSRQSEPYHEHGEDEFEYVND